MDNVFSNKYTTDSNREWALFLEAYRSYEIQKCHHKIYSSSWHRDGQTNAEISKNRIEKLSNASYQTLFDDFGSNLSESIEIALELDGDYNFFRLFDLMFTKKR